MVWKLFKEKNVLLIQATTWMNPNVLCNGQKPDSRITLYDSFNTTLGESKTIGTDWGQRGLIINFIMK